MNTQNAGEQWVKDYDTQEQVLEVILDNTLEALMPYLTKDNAQDLADTVKRYMDNNLVTELEIVNGNNCNGYIMGRAIELAKEFKEANHG